MPCLALGVAGLVFWWMRAAAPTGTRSRPPAHHRAAEVALPAVAIDCSRSPASLQQDLSAIAQRFDGTVGIAVTRVGCDWVAGERQAELFPQQSVSKLWVSMTVLDAVDQGRLALDQSLVISPNDLTVLNQPLRQQVLDQGSVTMPVLALMTQALSHSDNTANDRLLWSAGGPDRVRAMLREKHIDGIRFGPGERLLQSRIAGLQWNPTYSLGRNFYAARSQLPLDERKTALANYLTDPMDGAMPAGIAKALARLVRGQLLSSSSTVTLLDVLSRTHSGPMRLKAGAPRDWKVYHKTGTGQELDGVATGYNDVGILQAPDNAYYTVAVMIRQTRQPIPVRMHMMQAVSQAIVHFHEPDRALMPVAADAQEDAKAD